MAEGQTPNRSQSTTGSGSTRLQLINVLLVQITELSRQRSLLLSALQFSTDVTKADYSGFYSLFLQVYDLVSTMIPEKLSKDIKDWQLQGVAVVNNKDLRLKGLDLAEETIDALRDLGLLQVFEEPVKPPFMFDFELEEYKEIQLAKTKEAELKLLNPPVLTPVATEEPPKKKKKR